MSSTCLASRHPHEILIQWGHRSAASAYNEAIDRSKHDLIVFAHQDVFLGEGWLSQLERSLDVLQSMDPSWGVAGCYGITAERKYRGYLYSSCQAVHGVPFEQPMPVQTLDEILLVIRKSSGLRFDPDLPNFHLYGADICLTASSRGMRNYAICAPCIHNTKKNLVLPPEFYECCDYLKRSKPKQLPVQTTCVSLTRFGVPLLIRRMRELYPRWVLRKTKVETQVADVSSLVAAFDDAHRNRWGNQLTNRVSATRDCDGSLTGASS